MRAKKRRLIIKVHLDEVDINMLEILRKKYNSDFSLDFKDAEAVFLFLMRYEYMNSLKFPLLEKLEIKKEVADNGKLHKYYGNGAQQPVWHDENHTEVGDVKDGS